MTTKVKPRVKAYSTRGKLGINRNDVNSLDTLTRFLSQERQSGRTWRDISKNDFDGYPAGSLALILKRGYEPKNESARRKLGLPIYGRVELCRKCDKMHNLVKQCPDKRKRVRHSDKKLIDMPISVLVWKFRNRS